MGQIEAAVHAKIQRTFPVEQHLPVMPISDERPPERALSTVMTDLAMVATRGPSCGGSPWRWQAGIGRRGRSRFEMRNSAFIIAG